MELNYSYRCFPIMLYVHNPINHNLWHITTIPHLPMRVFPRFSLPVNISNGPITINNKPTISMKHIKLPLDIIGYSSDLIPIGYFGSMDSLPAIMRSYTRRSLPVNLNNEPI